MRRGVKEKERRGEGPITKKRKVDDKEEQEPEEQEENGNRAAKCGFEFDACGS